MKVSEAIRKGSEGRRRVVGRMFSFNPGIDSDVACCPLGAIVFAADYRIPKAIAFMGLEHPKHPDFRRVVAFMSERIRERFPDLNCPPVCDIPREIKDRHKNALLWMTCVEDPYDLFSQIAHFNDSLSLTFEEVAEILEANDL